MTGIMFIGISSAQSDFILKNEYLNRRYSGSGISEIIGLDHHGCVKECMSFSMCKSVDYVRPSRTCKLNNVSSSEISSSSLEIVTGAIFSDISDWPSVSNNRIVCTKFLINILIYINILFSIWYKQSFSKYCTYTCKFSSSHNFY
jgi:hypothetical protein